MASHAMKVLGAGAAILDLLARVTDAFVIEHSGGEKGGMLLHSGAGIDALLGRVCEENFALVRAIGGSAANTLFGLQHLGVPTAFLAKTGTDSEGAFYRDQYRALGGDLRSFKQTDAARTGRCVSLVTPDSERTMRTDLGASAMLSPDEITPDDFAGITHLHLEGYLLYNKPVFDRILALAKAAGCTVGLDLSSFEVARTFRKELLPVLRDSVDLVFANEDEAREFLGADSFHPEDALDALSSLCGTAVVKLGRNGALIRQAGQTARVGAELVTAIDTTGSGDLWQTGFLYGWLQGKNPELSGRFGAVTGAEIVQVLGAHIPDDRWPVIRARFAALEKQYS